MIIAAVPDEYDCGLESPDGGGWTIDGEFYEKNPRLTLPSGYFEMEQLWRWCEPEGHPPRLPEEGSVMDQAAVMLEAFDCMRGAWRRFQMSRREFHAVSHRAGRQP